VQYKKYDVQKMWTWRGIVIDLREEQEPNASDLMHVNSEFVSNEIDESGLQFEKHAKQRI
jgi:hypothetical protein